MIEIGHVEIPIVSQIEEVRECEIDEIKDAFKKIDVVPVQHEPSPTSLTIFGFLNEELHSDDLSLEEQRREIKKLRRQTDTIVLDYKDYFGSFLIEDIDLKEDGENKIIRSVEIEGTLHIYPKYQ